MSNDKAVKVDAVVVGGGMAGLWVLNVLRRRGYGAILLEAERLGGAQTLASQGIIHGGLKYTLGGATTPAGKAASQALDRWRACLAGCGAIDLRGLRPISDGFHLLAGAGTAARLSALLASKALRGRVSRLARRAFPEALQDATFRGLVYRLEDVVLDVSALIAHLARLAGSGIYRHALTPDDVASTTDQRIRIRLPAQELLANRIILAAGAGNEALMGGLGISHIPMQRRPLHQVIVRHPSLPPLYGHWLGAVGQTEPRLTITSHCDRHQLSGRHTASPPRLWYLGGQLATSGVAYDAPTQCQRAKAELEGCFPWMDWNRADFETLRIDRAEPRQPRGARPDRAFVEEAGACIVCWPTKLTLVPDLAAGVLALLPPPRFPSPEPLNLPAPEIGRPPWET